MYIRTRTLSIEARAHLLRQREDLKVLGSPGVHLQLKLLEKLEGSVALLGELGIW